MGRRIQRAPYATEQQGVETGAAVIGINPILGVDRHATGDCPNIIFETIAECPSSGINIGAKRGGHRETKSLATSTGNRTSRRWDIARKLVRFEDVIQRGKRDPNASNIYSCGASDPSDVPGANAARSGQQVIVVSCLAFGVGIVQV